MHADVLKIALAVFAIGLFTSSLSFDVDRDDELASAAPAALQQGVVVAQIPLDAQQAADASEADRSRIAN